MNLDFQPHSPGVLNAETLVLENARGWRIELILKGNDDDTFSLIALSGLGDQPAELCKGQGPYQLRDEGIAARSAIANQLLKKGFEYQEQAHSIWPLQAQKVIQQLRQQRKASKGNYAFSPDDVL